MNRANEGPIGCLLNDKRSERQFARDCYSELLTMLLRLLAAKFILL